MQYEILRERANGLEMPEAYAETMREACDIAEDLAGDATEGGYTGRAVVRDARDEAVYYVRMRGPLAMSVNYGAGEDIPRATWNGKHFDYWYAHNATRDHREFLNTPDSWLVKGREKLNKPGWFKYGEPVILAECVSRVMAEHKAAEYRPSYHTWTVHQIG